METQEIGIDAIERLGKIPKEIMKMLVISYMSLEDEYKKIFLFVACLLKGESKGNAIRKLESRGFHARNGLNVLEHRCLITLISSENGHVVLGVHDYIEEMAKNIVCREYLDEPNKHSGRWIGEKNEDMLANDKGTEATRSLNVNTSRGNSGIVIFYEYVREVSKASMFGLKKLQEQVLSNKRLLFSLGILITAYFYSMASSSNSSAPEIMVSTSNSSVENSFKYDVFLNFSGKDTRNAFLGHLYQDLQAKGIVTYKDDVDIVKGERINQLLKTIEESKLMVSTSNSSVENSFKYDVFLSFNGKDARYTIVAHLYKALTDKGIVTFKDDVDIEKGETINQLLKTIEESRFYIVVFSKNYASSSWCLKELVKIMECQKMIEHTAFPVFYDVEPTQVRKQNGPVGEAFSKHKNHEAAGKLRDAMKEFVDLAGWDLKATANGDESKLIQMIVDTIFIKKYSTLSNADGKLVGMETRISDVLSSLEIGTEDVIMIGIKGIGGGGKTTLARAVYDRISPLFEGKTIVENVREVSQPSLSGLKELQKQILEDVLHKKDITFSGVQDGKNMLKATMRCRKILVILDDVDRIEQLEALAGEHDWFKSGSRIIITTRDEQVLRAHRVDFVHDVNLLSSTEAIYLFSKYAFQKEIPIQGYEELSGQVVQYADGLPLTIKVLGSFLCGKDKLEWQDAIDRLKKIPLKETRETLELSYISLEDEYKEIFLYIVCILKGKRKEEAIRILESCGFHARNGLKVLEHRSLITISKCGVLGMHAHIEEMGKNIVRRGHRNEPSSIAHQKENLPCVEIPSCSQKRKIPF